MNSDYIIKKHVTPQQLETMYIFFTQHLDLARGIVTKHNVKQKLWDEFAQVLNAVPNGSVRDGKGWSKWWSDWKYRTKARYTDIKTAVDMQSTVPIVPLSEFDEKMLNLIGHNSADEEIAQDPLSEEESDESESYAPEKPKSRKRLKREHSQSPEPNSFTLCNDEELNSPPDRKPRFITTAEDATTDKESKAFLKLEEKKLRATNRIADSLENLVTEVRQMTNSLNQIADLFRSFTDRNIPN